MPSAAFLTVDWSPNSDPLSPGGSSWYRCLLPMVELKERGWPAGMGLPGWDDAHGFGLRQSPEVTIAGWSVVVLKLLMHRDTPEQVRRAQALGQKVVVDIDDFHADLHPDNVAAKGTDPMLNPDVNRQFHEQVIEAADMITVSTPFLLDYYAERHPCVRLIRNGIDFTRYSRIRDRAGWQPTIGWVGAIPWRSGDLETLRDWLPAFIGEHDLRVHHSGHLDDDPEHFWTKTGVKQSRMSTLQAALILDYPTLFTGFEVGIVPLNDIPFNHAKSTIKGLEYAASGIPFVAAATPEYIRLAELGIGRVASTPEEWVKHLTDLLDPGVRKREAATQRALVSREFSMRDRGAEWSTALEEVLAAPSRP